MLFMSLLVLLAASIGVPGPPGELGRDLDGLRVISKTAGNATWPGYGDAPFGLLLVADGHETLMCEDRLPAGFARGPRDPTTHCTTASRPASGLPANLLAAMPLFGPPSTIVMGTPEATGYKPVEWRRTVLHEHFHQWQAALPGYYDRTNALGLAGGDTTGMWMLNYPFPYDLPAADKAYRSASAALLAALELRGKAGFTQAFDRYLEARAAFSATVDAKAWRYLEFQLWQEGAARWTEIAVGRRSGDAELRDEAERVEARLLVKLAALDLKDQGRELAYPYGAGEALLMDACGPGWRAAYPKILEFGSLLRAARENCAANGRAAGAAS